MILIRALVLISLMATSLAGCGVRGDPQAPPQFVEAR